jgi:hypothetical protein
MFRAAAKRHIFDSNDHATNVQANIGRRAADAARFTRISMTYSSLHQDDFNSTFTSPAPPVQPTLFDKNDHPLDQVHNDTHFFSPMDDIIIPAGVTPLSNNLSLEHERLRREVELLMMEAEQIVELGPDYRDDDATLTNIDDNLDPFYVFNQEAEEDAQQDHFIETLADGDYTPYANKIVCHLAL